MGPPSPQVPLGTRGGRDHPVHPLDRPSGPSSLLPLQSGAIRHYSFDPFATRPKERCTAKALRGEAADVDTVTRVGRAPDQSDRDYFKSLGPKEPAAAR